MDRRQFGFVFAGTCATKLFGQKLKSSESKTEAVMLTTQHALFRIDTSGQVSSIQCDGRELVAAQQSSPLISLRIGGVLHPAREARWDSQRNHLTLGFGDLDASAVVAVQPHVSHIALEVREIQTRAQVELLVWGPYALSLSGLIGEVVGVVRNQDVAVGIQALNVKTLGGFPSEESDIAPDGVIADDHGLYTDLPLSLREKQSWRGDTATAAPYGSSLQAYCRNRDHLRVISNWGHAQFQAQPLADGGCIGSRIALFAVPANQALTALGEIEQAEGLPHPILNGTWAKQSPDATSSYLIADFGEHTIESAIEMTRRAGLKVLYHSSPFATWGHFELKGELFPNGWEGFRTCVQKARQAGLGVGFHTLSNFITTNDAYVTPKPSPHLARIASATLSADVDAVQAEIPVQRAEVFRQKTALNTIVIGEELIRYGGVSDEEPFHLLECQRGAWGTQAAVHGNGAVAALLMDHDYKVFLTDATLSVEVAKKIAEFTNRTGAIQLSLDGLEGNWSTGLGQYGCSLFTLEWYRALDPSFHGGVINDASNPHHFTWHIATRYNWGEPWYAGFRQSQTLLRLHNQLFYKRNLLPAMLGWFSIRPETTVGDIEWLCARAAGFDAGFCAVVSAESKAEHEVASLPPLDARMGALLDIVRVWETARMSDAFPSHIKPALQDVTRSFRLSQEGHEAWMLQALDPAGQPLRLRARRRPPATLL
jgi:hypothetical protein